MEIDLISTGIAATFAFAIGWTASWAAGKDAIEHLRKQVAQKVQIIAGKDQAIREQGRELGEHRAANLARLDQIRVASAAGHAAKAAKRAATAPPRKAPRTKSGAGAAAKKKG